MAREDGFTENIISRLQERVAKNLAVLYNHWMQDGGIPIAHATAKNFFIFKSTPDIKGATIDELGPISATSVFFKILEVLIKKRIETGTLGKRIVQL